MSAKWRRAKAWDAQHLTGPLTPVRWVLQAFSSITMAVCVLTTVALFGALASVPLGLFALIPTYLFYTAIFLGLAAVVMVGGGWLGNRVIAASDPTPAKRYIVQLFLAIATLSLTLWIWTQFAWPAVRYEPGIPPRGVRFFGSTVEAYRSTLLRQLPSWEMSELEFYGWLPFKILLYLFVANMIVATVRRIEFKFLNIGVLTVHTGIVLIASGSIMYDKAKVEGDMVLFMNGSPRGSFYDNTRAAIYVVGDDSNALFMAPLPGIARYNDAPADSEYAPDIRLHQDPKFQQMFSANLEISVVGIIPYGEERSEFRNGGTMFNPSVMVSAIIPAMGEQPERTVDLRRLVAASPSTNTEHTPDFAVQFLGHVPPDRFAELTTPFPEPGEHLLIAEIPETGAREVRTVALGDSFTVGEWQVVVEEFQRHDEGLSIISTGYRGAASSRLKVRVQDPDGTLARRSILHRYPELTQDFQADDAGAFSIRTDPDPRIRLTYIDATRTQIFVMNPNDDTKTFDVFVREAGGGIRSETVPQDGSFHAMGDATLPLRLKFSDYWSRTKLANFVVPVPAEDQDTKLRGNYAASFLDVEIRTRLNSGEMWTHREWLPFNQYLEQMTSSRQRVVQIPDLGPITLAFGRVHRQIAPRTNPMTGEPESTAFLSLVDFEMIPYPHSETPRDYVSTLMVHSAEHPDGQRYETRLNRPYIYRVPFRWDDQRNFIANSVSWLRTTLIPTQYKFSQAGWDPEAQAYTVLGVGNNPGIYVIAIGGILMGLGIPWAFYVKPAIQQARKRRIQRELAAGSTASSSDDVQSAYEDSRVSAQREDTPDAVGAES